MHPFITGEKFTKPFQVRHLVHRSSLKFLLTDYHSPTDTPLLRLRRCRPRQAMQTQSGHTVVSFPSSRKAPEHSRMQRHTTSSLLNIKLTLRRRKPHLRRPTMYSATRTSRSSSSSLLLRLSSLSSSHLLRHCPTSHHRMHLRRRHSQLNNRSSSTPSRRLSLDNLVGSTLLALASRREQGSA